VFPLFCYCLFLWFDIATASGFDGPWTPTPTTFNNAYFTLLLNLKWIPKEWDGPFQYVDASTGKLMMLPTDLVLLGTCTRMRRKEFSASDGETLIWALPISQLPFSFIVHAPVPVEDKKFMKYVQDYAKDASKFNKDFTAAFVKLEELGTSNLTPAEWA
jgi:cytochrome c peroxidase